MSDDAMNEMANTQPPFAQFLGMRMTAEPAKALQTFLAAPATAAVVKKNGMEPAARN